MKIVQNPGVAPPYCGTLLNLVADSDHADDLKQASRTWNSWDLTAPQLCHLELLLNGALSPLNHFMSRAEYQSVLTSMHLSDGTFWPLPITLDVSEEFARGADIGNTIALRDPEGVMLAALHIEDIWQPDRAAEAETLYDTGDPTHPHVSRLLQPWAIGGRVEGLQLPEHYDFRALRLTPAACRHTFVRKDWQRVIALPTRQILGRAESEAVMALRREHDAHVCIFPIAGTTMPDDIEYFTRIRCCQALLQHNSAHDIMLAILPFAARAAGGREVELLSIISQNYGCNLFLPGREYHGAPGAEQASEAIPRLAFPHTPDLSEIEALSIKTALTRGNELPPQRLHSDIIAELRRTYPPRHQQGFTVFFTGLSGSGKSTLANILRVHLQERGGRSITLLDGDLVRQNLSSELGFSKEHRDLNIRRIGFVANEITRSGGIAICAPIAPYDAVRQEVRQNIKHSGGFTLVHVATPLLVCEQRDRKGLYAKARAGIIQEFTGISDPYDVPQNADMTIDTSVLSAEDAVQQVLAYLRENGYLRM